MSRSRTAWWLKALNRFLFRAVPVRQRRRSCRLFVEALEDRVTPNAYLVNVATDSSGLVSACEAGRSNDRRAFAFEAGLAHPGGAVRAHAIKPASRLDKPN